MTVKNSPYIHYSVTGWCVYLLCGTCCTYITMLLCLTIFSGPILTLPVGDGFFISIQKFAYSVSSLPFKELSTQLGASVRLYFFH